jgi:hypothetical protein
LVFLIPEAEIPAAEIPAAEIPVITHNLDAI